MSTGHPINEHLYPHTAANTPQHPLKKGSHIMKRKSARKNRSQIHFRFGGNRKDPLNLNGLIRKRRQINAETPADAVINAVDSPNQHGNDRPVEILLQPDIFDPLRLDPSSRVDEDLNPLYSVPSTSTESEPMRNTRVYPSRTKRFLSKQQNQQQQHAPPRYGNFQGYYGYRQPNEDQRLQYLQPDWFQNKQVLDIGCHTGHVTFYVAEHFQPREIVGLDIDPNLVHQARNQLWHRIQTHPRPDTDLHRPETKRYPFNLRFQQTY